MIVPSARQPTHAVRARALAVVLGVVAGLFGGLLLSGTLTSVARIGLIAIAAIGTLFSVYRRSSSRS